MGIRFDISVSTPLSEEDDKVLAGLAYMTLALAFSEPGHSGPHTTRTSTGR